MDWSKYPNFRKEEFKCSHTGKNEMQPRFMEKLQQFRTKWNKPMTVTSGYRDKTHPIEAKKAKPGEHSKGLCADIAVGPADRHAFVKLAFELGFTRIGVANTFIHLGVATEADGHPSPRIWTY